MFHSGLFRTKILNQMKKKYQWKNKYIMTIQTTYNRYYIVGLIFYNEMAYNSLHVDDYL